VPFVFLWLLPFLLSKFSDKSENLDAFCHGNSPAVSLSISLTTDKPERIRLQRRARLKPAGEGPKTGNAGTLIALTNQMLECARCDGRANAPRRLKQLKVKLTASLTVRRCFGKRK
jgi:hypothetical protein